MLEIVYCCSYTEFVSTADIEALLLLMLLLIVMLLPLLVSFGYFTAYGPPRQCFSRARNYCK
jgi:hypothetical protein